MLTGKVWGSTEDLLITPLIEVHRIHIKPNMQCSMHAHEHKYNMFYILNGILEIHVQKKDYDLTDITRVVAGQWTAVRPGEFHKFVTKDAWCEALEIYYIDPINPADIIRQNVGGAVEEKSSGPSAVNTADTAYVVRHGTFTPKQEIDMKIKTGDESITTEEGC